MKEILKKIIIFIITIIARLILLRHRPKIIAVTGSVGKTSTKDAIYAGLKEKLNIRKNNKSLNSEIGVPLTIIGKESGWSNPLAWAKIILFGIKEIFFNSKYPKWLVLEVGIDRPGDMKKTAKWLKPDVAVFTTFSKVPVHVEFFDSVEAVWAEKSQLLKYVKTNGAVILNADDEPVLKLKNHAKVNVLTYSIKETNTADVFATNYDFIFESDLPKGIAFKINYDGNVLPVNLGGVLGEQHIYPSLIAFAVATLIKVNPLEIISGLEKQEYAPGRMRLLKGEKDSMIIDDSYNASPIAVKKALQVLSVLKNEKNKVVAVLGDMLELGRFSHSEHEKIGKLVSELKIDYLVTVGVRAEAIAESAIANGLSEEKVVSFEKSNKAIAYVRQLLGPNDIFLVKGSQGIRMERITKELIADKENSGKLLVRQEDEWKRR